MHGLRNTQFVRKLLILLIFAFHAASKLFWNCGYSEHSCEALKSAKIAVFQVTT